MPKNKSQHPGPGGEASSRKGGILFSAVNAAALVIIPLLAFATITHFLLTSGEFYTGIIRHSGFLTAFIESKNWETNKNIRDEIEEKVKLREAGMEFERVREAHDLAKKSFDDLNRTREYDYAKKHRKELSATSFDEVKDLYRSKEQFGAFRKAETAKLDALIGEIEKHRKENKKELRKLEGSMDDAGEKFDDAKSALGDKKSEAQKISDKHRGSMGAKVFADFELLEPRLTRLLNDRLVDGALREEIRKYLEFLTTYDSQRAYGRVFESGDRVSIRLPDISVSMWVDDDSLGVRRKRHLLSEVFVEEIGGSNMVQNRALYATMFKLFDSSLGESLGGSLLGKYGATLQNGVLGMRGITIEGKAADSLRAFMIALSYGKFLVFTLAAFVSLYAGFLYFSSRGRPAKRAALRRLCVYPSLVIVIAGTAIIVYANILFGFFAPASADMLLARLAASTAGAGSLYLCLPVMGAFALVLLPGLALRAGGKQV